MGQNAAVIGIRLYRNGDAHQVAEVIRRALREVNSRDYAAEIIERMTEHFTAARIEELAGQRQMFVAVGDEVAGTVSRDGNKVYTMFVRPDRLGEGIGRDLMGHVEALAAADGYDHVETGASLTARGFYRRLGYADVRTSDTGFGVSFIMRKRLR